MPAITAIIPARNEADILEQTLPTLLNHDYPGALNIILVDDRSEDGTASVAAQIAAQHNATERLHIVTAAPLPAGWKGKVWAMQCGLEQLQSSHYILFTDADIAYDKGALGELVRQAEADRLVLNSRMVRLRCKSVAEQFLIPAFVYFFRMLYPFNWVNQPKRTLAAAAGGCMLVRTDALARAGGLHAIRGALIDDCALARLLKPQGPIWLGLTQTIHSLRAYDDMNTIRQMVARSAYDQLGYSPLQLTGTIAGLLLTFIAPVLLALFATGNVQFIAVVCWASMAISFIPMLRFYGRPALQAPMLPLIALFYVGFTLDSAWQYWRGKGGQWKGRVQAGGVQRV